MEICALCQAPGPQSRLAFKHVHEGGRTDLEIALCADCGDRIEKHLKRAVPKRLMRLSPAARWVGRTRPPRLKKAGHTGSYAPQPA